MKIIPSRTEYQDRYAPGPMLGAVKTAAGIRGSFSFLHGVDGCTFAANQLRSAGPVVAGNYMPVEADGAQRSEIVLGNNEEMVTKLILREVKKLRTPPGVLFLFTSCATSIIHEDLQMVADTVHQETGSTVLPIDTGGYLGGFNWGSEQVWNAVLRKYAPEKPATQQGINLVGPHLMGSRNWPNDIKEIERLLAAADVPVNATVFRSIDTKALPKIGAAAHNYILSCEDFPDYEKECADRGMPRWGGDLVLPLGMRNTEEWYLAMARQFGNEAKAKKQLDADMDLVKAQMRGNYNATWALQAMSGKHAGVLGFAPFAAAMARSLFYDFNMRPNVIGLFAETPGGLRRAEEQLKCLDGLCDIEVLENPSYMDWVNKLKEAQVEMSVGMRYDHALTRGAGIPHRSLGGWYFYNMFNFVPWPYMGVRGMLYLTGELWEVTQDVLSADDLWEKRRFRTRDELEQAVAAS